MPIKHNKEKIINYLKEDVCKEQITSLYDKKYVKYLGQVINSNQFYYDIIAEYLLDHVDLFESNIHKISRHSVGKTYNEKRGQLKDDYKIYKDEVLYAKSLYQKEFDLLGKIIHYQTPIYNSKKKKIGAVDLLSFKENMLSLIELKMFHNDETLLRAILEIATYYMCISVTELLKDFNLPLDTKIQKVVLIFKDSRQHQQYLKSDFVRQLAKKLDVEILIFDTVITTP